MQIGDKVLVTSGRYERIETVVRVTAKQVHTDNNCGCSDERGARMRITRQVAVRRLTNRWNKECLCWPLMRESIPLAVYIAANVDTVMRKGLLAGYEA